MKSPFLFGILLATVSGAGFAAPTAPTQSQIDQAHALNLIVHASYYSPFGEFYLDLSGFIRGLFLSQTHDSTDPVDFNDLPLVSFDDVPDAYDFALGEP